jgi:hypothetical protein
MSKYDVGFRRDANGEWQIIDDGNDMTEVEIVQATRLMRDRLGLPNVAEIIQTMADIRKELGYEYDASVEFDMPLNHYEVSAETFGG